MADLAQALNAALRARYRIAEVRTPITQRRGLLARMNQLEKLHKREGDTPAATRKRAAEAAGIPDRTWRDWRKGTHPPSARSRRKLEGAYDQQIRQPALKRTVNRKGAPNRVTVTATVKWSKSPENQYNATPHRTVKLTGMRPVMVNVIRAWARGDLQGAADAFERGAAAVYSVRDDDDGSSGIEFQGNQVEIEFP